jgi:di/tricarboxylate transporter
MTIQAIVTLAVLIASLLVLATQRLRPDLTALCVLVALVLTGVLTPVEAFSAFGQPVIIVIAAIYVIGAALYETGVATLIANRLSRFGAQGLGVLLPVVMLTAGLLSAVLSSMLVIALLMPAVLRIARKARLPPSQLLLPLVAAATMGNLLTVIGTISTVVVSDLLLVNGHDSLSFFSVAPYGLASLALAIAWYTLIGRRLLRQDLSQDPHLPSLGEVEHAYGLDRQLYRLRVRSASDLIARTLTNSPLSTERRLNVLAVQPSGKSMVPADPDWVLDRNDVLIVEGAKGDVLQATSLHHLESKGGMSLEEFNRFEQETLRLAELMVPFRSRLVGKTLANAHFRERYGLNILAVHRQGRAIREDLPELTLDVGDSLLVQGALSRLRRVGDGLDLVLVTHLGPQPGDLIGSKARLTLGILGVMIVTVVTGLLSLAVASLLAALALILTGCLSVHRAYRSINGSVLVLIGGMLPLALALEKTGMAGWIASQLASPGSGIGPAGLLIFLYAFAMVLTQVISNSVATALMTPIGISLAVAQGLSPQPFALAIAIAVTTSYMTPLTNADNLLVREAGRYTMRDYIVNGVPLGLLQAVLLIPLLLVL